jgi:hypothetical protein
MTRPEVELRLYDRSNQEIRRISEFVDLEFEERLVGGSDSLRAVVSYEHFDHLPPFCYGRVWVLDSETGEMEAWWGGVIEEVNPKHPNPDACTLVGQGFRRVFQWLGVQEVSYYRDLQPAIDSAGSALPDPHSLLPVVEGFWRNVCEGPPHGYYSSALSITSADLSPTLDTFAGLVEHAFSVSVDGQRVVDNFVEESQHPNTPFMIWVEPDGSLQINTLSENPQEVLIEDLTFVDIDARRDTSNLYNSVEVVFPGYRGVISNPYMTSNLFPNAAFEEWDIETVPYGVTTVDDPDSVWQWAVHSPSGWACEDWMFGFGVRDQGVAGLDHYKLCQEYRPPWRDDKVLPPRGYGTVGARLELSRSSGVTGPFYTAAALAWSGWPSATGLVQAVDGRVGQRISYPAGRQGLWAALGFEADGSLADLEYKWKLVSYDETDTEMGRWDSGWSAVLSVTSSGALLPENAVYASLNLETEGLYSVTEPYTSLWVEFALRGGVSADNLLVKLYGIKMEPSTSVTPAVFTPDTELRMYYNTEDVEMGFAATSPEYQSVEVYGLRHKQVESPYPYEGVWIGMASDLQVQVADQLVVQSIPRWRIKGKWVGETKRFKPQDGPLRIHSDEDYGGQVFSLERVRYHLKSQGLTPELHLGTRMRHRLPSEGIDESDYYVPPRKVDDTDV